MKNVDAIRQFIHSEIEQHRDTYDPDNMRDLVDLYIQAEKNDFKDMKEMEGMIRALGLFTSGYVKKNTSAHFIMFTCGKIIMFVRCQINSTVLRLTVSTM